jgi:hypothetical protein
MEGRAESHYAAQGSLELAILLSARIIGHHHAQLIYTSEMGDCMIYNYTPKELSKNMCIYVKIFTNTHTYPVKKSNTIYASM